VRGDQGVKRGECGREGGGWGRGVRVEGRDHCEGCVRGKGGERGDGWMCVDGGSLGRKRREGVEAGKTRKG